MKLFLIFLKIFVSGGLLAWIIIRVIDISQVPNFLSKANLSLIVLAFIMRIIGFLIGSFRWQKLLLSQGVNIKLFSLLDSYIIASFFNLFLPTRIGGDVFRISDTRRAANSILHSASVVFAERFFGIFILLIFALFAAISQLHLAQEIPAIWIGIVVGFSGLFTLLLIIYTQCIDRLLNMISTIRIGTKLLSNWKLFRSESFQLITKRKPLAWGLLFSFLLQINVVLHYWIIGNALGFNISLINYFFLIPIQLLILMLPSINGIGLREASNIFLFGYYGILPTEAATFGFLDLALMLATGFLGWFRFIARRSQPADKSKLSPIS